MKIFCYLIGFLINVYLLWYMKLDTVNSGNERKLEFEEDWIKNIYIISQLIFGFFCFIYSILWWTFRYWRERLQYIEIYKRQNPTTDINDIKVRAQIAYLTWYKDKAAVNLCLHFIFAILGVFVSPFFSTLHLLLIININETAQYVFTASTIHGDQLLITLMLGIFFIYQYAYLNANFYSGLFSDMGSIDTCKSLISCFSYSINMGFRNGGGIADSHEILPWDNKQDELIMKTFFDLSYFIIINVIQLNIIFGIIIDTFGEMRSDSSERETKFGERCLMCQIEKSDFEENRVEFQSHTEVDHEMWLYPYYIMYLNQKDEKDYNGDELYAFSCYNERSDDWIPFKKTQYLKGYESEEDMNDTIAKVQTTLEDIKGEVTSNNDLLNEIKESVEKQQQLKN